MLLIAALLIAGVTIVIWLRALRTEAISRLVVPPPSEAASAQPREPAATVESAVHAVNTLALRRDNPAEIIASARMYTAHAPLRAPEVADPDSTANRVILDTMVRKALTRGMDESRKLPSGDLPVTP